MGRPRHTSSKHFLLQHGFHLIKSLCRLASSREGDSGAPGRRSTYAVWSHCSSWLDLTRINYFWEILSSAGHMTQWTHIQCFPLCVGICACEPLLPLWVHLGGSSLGSCALIRSTTGHGHYAIRDNKFNMRNGARVREPATQSSTLPTV